MNRTIFTMLVSVSFGSSLFVFAGPAPAFAEEADLDSLWAMEPLATRSGLPRFLGPEFQVEGAAAVLMDRLVQAGDPSDVRVALVDAIRRTNDDWSASMADVLRSEPDASVRVAMVDALRYGDQAVALKALEKAMKDEEATVRTAAVRSVAYCEGADALGSQINELIRDFDASVRSAATRTAGTLQLQSAWNELVWLSQDADSENRLHAIRALQRINPTKAASLPEIQSLVDDVDAKVSRAARQITGR